MKPTSWRGKLAGGSAKRSNRTIMFVFFYYFQYSSQINRNGLDFEVSLKVGGGKNDIVVRTMDSADLLSYAQPPLRTVNEGF